MRIHGLATAAAAICILFLTACGGGGSDSTRSDVGGTPGAGSGGTPGQIPGGGQAPVRSSVSIAATALPIAGSVTQSSDVSQGVTANTVEATVSLDSRGLLAADVSGKGWRIRNQAAWSRGREGAWTSAGFVQQQSDGAQRSVTVITDRAPTPDRAVASGDVWVSSVRYDEDGAWTALYDGMAGTLNGVEGTLFCAGDCEVSPVAVGAPAVPGQPVPEPATPGSGDPFTFGGENGFRFIRKSDAQNAPADSDYLILGYWDRVPKRWLHDGIVCCIDWDDEGFSLQYYADIEYGFFVNGSDPFEQSDIRSLVGTATYNGEAVALYVDTNIDPRLGYGKEAPLQADVTLTANFASGTQNGTVSGSIRNFQSLYYDPEYPDEPWGLARVPTALTLKSAPIGNSHSGFFVGDTAMTFDGSSFAGKWGGQFYGNGEADGRPGSAAGTFGAATSDGSKSILGGFGAYKR